MPLDVYAAALSHGYALSRVLRPVDGWAAWRVRETAHGMLPDNVYAARRH